MVDRPVNVLTVMKLMLYVDVWLIA
jgi:hypothetical protein